MKLRELADELQELVGYGLGDCEVSLEKIAVMKKHRTSHVVDLSTPIVGVAIRCGDSDPDEIKIVMGIEDLSDTMAMGRVYKIPNVWLAEKRRVDDS